MSVRDPNAELRAHVAVGGSDPGDVLSLSVGTGDHHVESVDNQIGIWISGEGRDDGTKGRRRYCLDLPGTQQDLLTLDRKLWKQMASATKASRGQKWHNDSGR
jgi:hypothetical protein